MKLKKMKLPAFQKALSGTDENFFVGNYIMFKNKHAIISDGHDVLICNLDLLIETYKDSAIVDFLYPVMKFLENKFITGKYWEEIIKADYIEVNESEEGEYLEVTTNGMRKDMFYISPPEGNTKGLIDKVIGVFESYAVMERVAVDRSNVSMTFINDMLTVFGGDLKTDRIILMNNGKSKHSIYTFDTNRHIFGMLSNIFDLNEEMFVDVNMKNLYAPEPDMELVKE